MLITGTIINVVAVVAGSLLGLLFHARLPQRFVKTLFQGIGLFTVVLGISMALSADKWILIILSLIAGGVAGEWLQLEAFFENLAGRIGKKFRVGSAKFNKGLLTAFLLYCMGSLTILGAIEEGMGGKPELYYIKSLMDGISSIALASGLGVGVLFSVVPLFLYQGGLTLLASWFGAFVPEMMMNGITSAGGILLLGLGLNILEITKIKILNLLPALLFVVLSSWVYLVWIS